MAAKRKSKGGTNALSRDSGKYFPVKISLQDTGEMYTLKKVYNEMTIRELRAYAEFMTGIPYNLQRLTYLDEGDLLENTDVRHNDIVAGGTLKLNVWHTWRTLVEAAAGNDVEWLFTLGVTQDTAFKTPNSDFMGSQSKMAWIAERAFTALFIAAHRGHMKLCQKLIEAGANVNAMTRLGRTPLHVAAARGHGEIVDMLLGKGANINATDTNGDTALAVAGKFGHKGCERHLFLFQWQERAKTMTSHPEQGLFAHQYFDSAFPVWFKGHHGQVYYTKILPPGEFEGTSLGAPRRDNGPVAGPGSRAESTRQEHRSDSRSHTDTPNTVMTRPESSFSQMSAPGSIIRSGRRGTGRRSGYQGSKEESRPVRSIAFANDVEEITSAHSHRRRVEKEEKQNPKSFTEWLARKKMQETAAGAAKREEKERRRLAAEDRKLQEEIEDQSYKAWLQEKQETATILKSNSAATYRRPLEDRGGRHPLIRDMFYNAENKWTAYEMWERRNEIDIIEEIRRGNIPKSMKSY